MIKLVRKITYKKSLKEILDEETLDKLILDVRELKTILKDSTALNKLEKKLLKMKKENKLDIATMDYTNKMVNAFDDYKYFQKMANGN